MQYQDHEAVISIPEGKLLEGSLPKSKTKLVHAWIEIHQDELMADWRLPSIYELEGIGTDPPATWETGLPPVTWTKPGAPFTNVQSGYYWSGTSYANFPDYAWTVYMSDGGVYLSSKSDFNFYVWPVRSGN